MKTTHEGRDLPEALSLSLKYKLPLEIPCCSLGLGSGSRQKTLHAAEAGFMKHGANLFCPAAGRQRMPGAFGNCPGNVVPQTSQIYCCNFHQTPDTVNVSKGFIVLSEEDRLFSLPYRMTSPIPAACRTGSYPGARCSGLAALEL